MPFQLINIDSSFSREKLLCRDAAINRYYSYYYYIIIIVTIIIIIIIIIK